MDIGVSTRVIARDEFGLFIAECEMAGQRTVEKAVDEGARLARDFAPIGHKHDTRTVPLHQSIKTRMRGRTAGEWYSTARHALPQEFGAGPHLITGSPGLSFYWESAGRWFVPASEFYHEANKITIVNHPGNPSHPFLRPSYAAVMNRIMSIAKGEYPN